MVGETRWRGLTDIAGDLASLIDRPAGDASRPLLMAGLLGRAIQGSLSPRMHEAEGARLGLRYAYRLFDFDQLALQDSDLPRFVEKLRRAGYAGFNVTHPFKERVVETLDRLSDDAAAVGAVNTVVFEKDAAVGYNTDCWGFAESFRQGLSDASLDEVLLLGAGGAGMAVAKALMDLGAGRVSIFDTDLAKAARLARAMASAFGKTRAAEIADLRSAVGHADGLVNATPVGMAKYPGTPVDPALLRADLWVADIVYFPADTVLLRAAAEAGCRTLSGAGMAIFQAVKAFELITDARPDAASMARHFAALT